MPVAVTTYINHNNHNYCVLFLFTVCAALLLASAPSAHAAREVTLAWEPSTDADITGYRLHYGSQAGNYSQVIDVGNTTTAKLSNLSEGSTYYIAATAYNIAGVESLPSNEIEFTVAANEPPIVNLTSPQTGATFNALTAVALSAIASDPDGNITKVEFYHDFSTKIGEATSSPYTAVWGNVPAGNYSLSAIAYDDSGAAVRSAEVSVSVINSTPAPTPTPSPSPTSTPTITVSASSALVGEGGNTTFTVSVSPVSSQAITVNYEVGGRAKLGTDYTLSGPTGKMVIPAGQSAATITLNALTDSLLEPSEVARIKLTPGAGYQRSSVRKAMVTIIDR